MQLKFTRMEKAVGTFVIGIAVLLLSTVVIIGRGKDWFEKYTTYYTTFNEGYNFQKNTPVKLFKTDIGKVKEITLAENKVKVTLAILEKVAVRITQGTLTTVESPTFIGSEYISIIPGLKSAPLIPEEGEIPSREKKSISDILAEFEVEKTAMMVVKAVQDLAELARLLKEPKGPLLTTLDNIKKMTGHFEGIAAGIEKGEGSLGSLIKSQALVEAIQANLAQIEQILANLNIASQQTPLAMEKVNETLTGIQPVVKQIESAVTSLKAILHNLEQGSMEVPRITRSTGEGIEEIRQGVADIDKVVKSVQQNVFIRSHLPPEPSPADTAAGLRR
jgi:phospholipid/cholesterol/gamma-HCH transport system substrate-binding protein